MAPPQGNEMAITAETVNYRFNDFKRAAEKKFEHYDDHVVEMVAFKTSLESNIKLIAKISGFLGITNVAGLISGLYLLYHFLVANK